MAKNFVFYFFFILCSFEAAIAQNSYSISGLVKDKKEPLPGAAVYVSGYKIAAVTDNNGNFILPNLQPGSYDILVQMIGYLPYSKNIIVSDQSIRIEVVLKENVTLLNAVVIKPDPFRDNYIDLFKDFFLGRTPNAKECRLLNTQVLNVHDDKEKGVIEITANDFLIVENLALGYKIKYLLKVFEYNYKKKIFYYTGYPYFEELTGNKAKENKWIKNRQIAFNGSQQHFFKSLYANKITSEGFILHKVKFVSNPDRLPDSLIGANITRLSAVLKQKRDASLLTQQIDATIKANPGTQKTTFTMTNANDSLGYWFKQQKVPKQIGIIDRKAISTDTLVRTYNGNLKMINYTDDLYIVYKNEAEDATYFYSEYRQERPKELKDYQISVVHMFQPPFRFYPNGSIVDSRNLLNKGYWAYQKMADSVPLDYEPTTKKEKK